MLLPAPPPWPLGRIFYSQWGGRAPGPPLVFCFLFFKTPARPPPRGGSAPHRPRDQNGTARLTLNTLMTQKFPVETFFRTLCAALRPKSLVRPAPHDVPRWLLAALQDLSLDPGLLRCMASRRDSSVPPFYYRFLPYALRPRESYAYGL